MVMKARRTNNFIACSGGLEIWVSSTSFQKSDIGWPQQPLTEKVLKFNMIFYDSTKKNFFQSIKIKLMTLKSSVLLFQALKSLQPQWPQWPQQPQWPQWPQQPHFIKKSTDPDGLIIPGTQMTNTSPFLWNGSSKFQFFTDIWYLSVGGCWGQQMLLFQKLITETQISKPPEPAMDHNSIKLMILLPFIAIYFRS